MLNRLQCKKWAMEDRLNNIGLFIGTCLFIFLAILFALWFGATFLFYEDGDEINRKVAAIQNAIFMLPALKWMGIVALGSGGVSCFVLLLFSIFNKEFIRDKSVQKKICLVVVVTVFCFMLAWGIWLMPNMSMDILNLHPTICLILRWIGMSVGILAMIIAFVAVFIFLA